jgi:hypothetical protein
MARLIMFGPPRAITSGEEVRLNCAMGYGSAWRYRALGSLLTIDQLKLITTGVELNRRIGRQACRPIS